MALWLSGKSLPTELWILLASWHVTLKTFVASTIRTCLLTTCALALAPVLCMVHLICVDLPPSLQLTSIISVSPPPLRLFRLRLRLTLRLRLRVRVRVRVRVSRRVRVKLRVKLRVVGSVLVATPGSVHTTCIELQLLISLGLGLGLGLGWKGEWLDPS